MIAYFVGEIGHVRFLKMTFFDLTIPTFSFQFMPVSSIFVAGYENREFKG